MPNMPVSQPVMPPDASSNDTNTRLVLRWLRTFASSWAGSVVLHALLLLLLVLFAPMSERNRGVPGERMTENVGIVFAPANSGHGVSYASSSQQASESQPSQQISATDIAAQYMAALAPRTVQGNTSDQNETLDIATIGAMQIAEAIGGNAPRTDTGPSGGTGSGNGSGNGTGTGGLTGVTGSFMGAQGTGRNFVYVIDRSNSTGFGNRRSPIYVAKNELLASLQSLGEMGLRESKPIRFQIVFFNNTTAVFNTIGYGGTDKAGRLITYDQKALENVQRFLGGIISDGGTQPEPALMQAIRMGADSIFFMTDGQTRITPAQLQRINAAAQGVQINVVEYGSGNRQRNSNLQKLAADNNGNHVFVDLSKLPR